MRILIARNGEDIVCVKEYVDVKDKGEIAHFIAELGIIKQDLLEMWDEWNGNEHTIQ